MENPERITYFAETDYRNKQEKFGIKAKDRARHLYVIGKTGMGKSTLLDNMAIQDMEQGNGFAFLDPHGSSADLLLDYIPESRLDDVLYFAPFDTEYPISFNILEDVGHDKRHLVVSGLMSVFEKIWVDAWSSRMSYILQNTLAALLEYPDATLLGVNRMYVDKAYRNKVVDNVTDPAVKTFWTDEFAQYTDRFAREATPAIQNKIGQFVSNPMIRNIIGQPESSFDPRDFMDERKILIVNLSKGQVGEKNAELLGGMLVTKIYLAALSRADARNEDMAQLPHFNLFVDEFQSFANKSFADILSEARKYKLNLHIAHQYIEQMPEEVAAAVFGNVGTMITFRIGGADAEVVEKEFAPKFTAEDLVNLGKFQMYLKLMVDGVSSPPFSARTFPHPDKPRVSYRDMVIARSREHYARPREEVEEEIIRWHDLRAGKGGGQQKKGGKGGKNKKSKKGGKGGKKKQSQDEREADVRRAMSLSDLKEGAKQKKKKKKKSKGPSEENVAELREALSEVLKERDQEGKNKSQEDAKKEKNKKNKKKKKKKKKKKQKQSSEGDAKEVPKDVLKKMLEMDS